jgi:hypothetical protein
MDLVRGLCIYTITFTRFCFHCLLNVAIVRIFLCTSLLRQKLKFSLVLCGSSNVFVSQVLVSG